MTVIKTTPAGIAEISSALAPASVVDRAPQLAPYRFRPGENGWMPKRNLLRDIAEERLGTADGQARLGRMVDKQCELAERGSSRAYREIRETLEPPAAESVSQQVIQVDIAGWPATDTQVESVAHDIADPQRLKLVTDPELGL